MPEEGLKRTVKDRVGGRAQIIRDEVKKTAITVKKAGHDVGESMKTMREEAKKTTGTVKTAGREVGASVGTIREEAKKTATTIKQAGRDLLKDPAAQEAKDLAEGIAKGVSRQGKAIYSKVSKRIKESKSKGW